MGSTHESSTPRRRHPKPFAMPKCIERIIDQRRREAGPHSRARYDRQQHKLRQVGRAIARVNHRTGRDHLTRRELGLAIGSSAPTCRSYIAEWRDLGVLVQVGPRAFRLKAQGVCNEALGKKGKSFSLSDRDCVELTGPYENRAAMLPTEAGSPEKRVQQVSTGNREAQPPVKPVSASERQADATNAVGSNPPPPAPTRDVPGDVAHKCAQDDDGPEAWVARLRATAARMGIGGREEEPAQEPLRPPVRASRQEAKQEVPVSREAPPGPPESLQRAVPPRGLRVPIGELRDAVPPEWEADLGKLMRWAVSMSTVARAVETTRHNLARRKVRDPGAYLCGTMRDMALGIPAPHAIASAIA